MRISHVFSVPMFTCAGSTFSTYVRKHNLPTQIFLHVLPIYIVYFNVKLPNISDIYFMCYFSLFLKYTILFTMSRELATPHCAKSLSRISIVVYTVILCLCYFVKQLNLGSWIFKFRKKLIRWSGYSTANYIMSIMLWLLI